MTTPPAPAPAAPSVPTVAVAIAGGRTVRFDFETIDRIEESTGLGFQQIADRFWAMMPRDVPDGGRPTPEQVSAAARRFRLGFAARFVAGCLGMNLEQLAAAAKSSEVLDAFNALAPGFIDCFNAMVGEASEKKGSSTASSGSGSGSTPPAGSPGDGSTSASAGTSSAGSGPGSSAPSSPTGAAASGWPTDASASSPP